MTFATDMQDVASSLIQEFGSDAVFTRTTTAGTYSPVSGSVTGSAATSTTVKAAGGPVSDHLVNGDSIRSGDFVLFMYAKNLGFEPTVGDRVQFNGDRWVVTKFDTFTAQDTKIMFKAMLRKHRGD